MRYVVVGTSGAGKSTFAKTLAAATGAPHVELDALHWGPNWTERDRGEFAQSVRAATTGERWVVDGNYSVVRDVFWPAATHVVWLNFSRRVVFTRIVRRTLWRTFTRESLWHGNRDTFTKAFFSRESILWWSFTTFDKNRRKYAGLREASPYAHLQWHELRSPREAQAFLVRARVV